MVSGLSQVSNMAGRSKSLSEINFKITVCFLDIDLMFVYEIFKDLTGPGFGLMSPAIRGKIQS